MNAVARVILVENNLFKKLFGSFDLSEIKALFLIFLLLSSALGVVYIKDLNRRLFITSHALQKHTQQLKADSSRLLLKQSALGAQAKIQHLAQKQLQMQIPPNSKVIMLKI